MDLLGKDAKNTEAILPLKKLVNQTPGMLPGRPPVFEQTIEPI